LKNIKSYDINKVTAYVFVVDTLNFCFWPNGNSEGDFEYENMTRNLEKLLDEDPEFFTPKRLAIVEESLIKEKIFDGRNFGLLDERARLLRQLGAAFVNLNETFEEFVKSQGTVVDCVDLVRRITELLPGFRD